MKIVPFAGFVKIDTHGRPKSTGRVVASVSTSPVCIGYDVVYDDRKAIALQDEEFHFLVPVSAIAARIIWEEQPNA